MEKKAMVVERIHTQLESIYWIAEDNMIGDIFEDLRELLYFDLDEKLEGSFVSIFIDSSFFIKDKKARFRRSMGSYI